MESQDRSLTILSGIFTCIFLSGMMIILLNDTQEKRLPTPTRSPEPPVQNPRGRANRPVKGIGEIINVVDGDTMDALMDIGLETYRKIRIRLARVDTPETRGKDEEEKKKAAEATSFVKERILGKSVMIIVSGKDSFGRYIAEIWYTVDHGAMKNLSDELLANGLAKKYKK